MSKEIDEFSLQAATFNKPLHKISVGGISTPTPTDSYITKVEIQRVGSNEDVRVLPAGAEFEIFVEGQAKNTSLFDLWYALVTCKDSSGTIACYDTTTILAGCTTHQFIGVGNPNPCISAKMKLDTFPAGFGPKNIMPDFGIVLYFKLWGISDWEAVPPPYEW